MDEENVIHFHFQTLHNHVSVPQMFLHMFAGTTGDCCRNRQPLPPRQSGREREES